MKNRPAAVILAAGKGTRMRSERAKVLHEVAGRAMVLHVIDAAGDAGCAPIVAVIGHQRETVRDTIADRALTVVQEEQLGTGHAVACAESTLGDRDGYLVVLSGDVPLIRGRTISGLIGQAQKQNADAALLTMEVPAPNRYGKVVRADDGSVARVVEDKDANEVERQIPEVNAGIYAFRLPALFADLKRISNDNAQGEYYLPDVIGLAVAEGRKVAAWCVDDPEEVMGVDTPEALAKAEKAWQRRQG